MRKINEVSKLVGVSKRTLQYYDDEGLISVVRSSENHRIYDQHSLELIWEILIYKEMGFELKEIKEICSASEDNKKQYFSEKIDKITGQMSALDEQVCLINYVLRVGMPSVPLEIRGDSFVSSIGELRKSIISNYNGRK